MPANALIYAGIGWDSEFLDVMKDYNKFIAYDTLPGFAHYRKGQRGWRSSKSKQCFFRQLRRSYGTYEKLPGGRLHFKDTGIMYHYSVNAHHVKVPPGDILVRGYVCESWIREFNDPNRKIWATCDTNLHFLNDCDIDYEVVHFCDGGYCAFMDASDSDDDDQGGKKGVRRGR